MGIWLVAFCLAIPQAIQFGVVYIDNRGPSCTVSICFVNGFVISLSWLCGNRQLGSEKVKRRTSGGN